jgi:Domain of unknown function (DUF222)
MFETMIHGPEGRWVMTELASGCDADGEDGATPPRYGLYLVPPTDRPPEYADVPIRELFDRIDAGRGLRAADDEVLAAGFCPRPPSSAAEPGSGFETGGALDTCAPDGVLAGLADAVTRDARLAELNDDELIGVLRAWRRLESWCSAGVLAAIAELARRRPADKTPPAPPGQFPAQVSEFVSDEVAAALTLTGPAAGVLSEVALDLAIRLPGTFRAQRAGIIDYPRARLIAESTRILTDEQARQVEAKILPAAGEQTTGRLRAALARAVIAVDPQAATRRREEAQKDPRVRRWREDAGTAALAGYSLPPADVLAADQRLTDRAVALRDAGLPGSRKLQHLIWARTPTCTAPGCRRPAARCDLDHSTPYDQGGRTCECNVAPLCRHHHRCKQSEGWCLEQPQPGVLRWTTPAGRHYLTAPEPYP